MNVIFLGTPEFGIEPLKAIMKAGHNILAVISQPDRETDRKGKLKKTPVARFAMENNLPLKQFENVGRDGISFLKGLRADAAVTAAYGQMLPESFLSLFKYGTLNIHGSLLPLYRGSSPIQTAILNGDKVTGVTIMRTVKAMDAGDILLQKEIPITEDTDSGMLYEKMSYVGAELIAEAIGLIESGKARFTAQDEKRATYTKKIVRADALIDFSETSFKAVRQINAFSPRPGAYTFLNGEQIKIYSADEAAALSDTFKGLQKALKNYPAGTILSADELNGITVKCGEGCIRLTALQAAGKNRLAGCEFLRGYKLILGEVFKNA